MNLQNLVPLLLTHMLLIVPVSSVRASDLIVDNDELQCPGAQFLTIQAAVVAAAAMPGTQKIRICAGSYPENIRGKPLIARPAASFGEASRHVRSIFGIVRVLLEKIERPPL